MTERDRFDLEMSPGTQPPSGLGDRVLVGLALIALLGGTAIAIANLLPHSAEVAETSEVPSTAPTPTPGAIPTPVPPRVVSVGQPSVTVVPATQPFTFSGWIRAKADLVVHSGTDPDGAQVGVLGRGEVAYADQQDLPAGEPGWLHLQPPAPDGWIASISGGTQLVKRYPDPLYPTSGSLYSLAAGPGGFVALAGQPGDSHTYHPPRPVSSTDGAVWRASEPSAFGDAEIVGMAHGPAGWLAAGNVNGESSVQVWMWSSPDGLRWSRLGAMRGLANEYVTQVLAADRGYLLQTTDAGRGPSARNTLWVSADMITWREVLDPLVTNSPGWRRTIAVPAGFLTWDASSPFAPAAPSAAFSSDGERWRSAAVGGPGSANLQITGLGDRILAFDIDPQTLAPRVWVASVAGHEVIWSRETDAEAFFSGGVVTQVVSRGARTFAFGWDRSSEEPLVWSGDGLHWLRSSLPAAFGGVPQLAAAGPAGVVVVGHRPSLRGDNPIFWHRTATGAWLAEQRAVLDAVPDPSADGCPPVPQDILEFLTIDRAAATACFGDATITFRAWSESCPDCGGSGPGVSQPEWLMSPTTNQLYLAPIDDQGTWWTTVVTGPSLQIDRTWTRAWLRLTGHFDDPAAATCHYEPTVDDIAYWGGQRTVIEGCRQTFVVTEVKVVSGP